MARFEGKVVIVTGAASGIGQATALRFAEDGARAVIVADWSEAGSETAAAIGKRGIESLFVRTDVSSAAEVQNLVSTVEQRFGRLDVLVNNAGVLHERVPLEDISEQDWNRTIAANLTGVFLGMKYGIPALLRAGGGAICNTASMAGLVGVTGISAYSASKGGVVMLTKTAAVEYAAKNIRINCVCPGGVATPMILGGRPPEDGDAGQQMPTEGPLGGLEGRLARPGEIAAAITYLCSDDASYITGVALPVDAGAVAA